MLNLTEGLSLKEYKNRASRDVYFKLTDVILEEEKVRGLPSRCVIGSEKYTSSGRAVGAGFYYNPPSSSYALCFAIAHLARENVVSVLEMENDSYLIFDQLVQKKVLQDRKILDLGCGIEPGYANCLDALGAEVYTVDVQHEQKIAFANSQLRKRHIEADLCDLWCIDPILRTSLKTTQGLFDLVSETIIGTTPDNHRSIQKPNKEMLEFIANAVLKTGGIYYGSLSPPKIKV